MSQLEIRPFNEVFSREEIEEVDNKIMEAQRKHEAKLYSAFLNTKDFPMNN